jgi:cardiolipin synthase
VSHANALLRDGHEVQLLEGSVEYFPALIAGHWTGPAPSAAGDLHLRPDRQRRRYRAGPDAARRAGACHVQVMVDGYGTGAIPDPWPERLAAAGVQWAVYSPPGTLGLLVPGRWRRLHRKLCVVDGDTAFCGGINILDDFHDPNHGGAGRAAL